MLKEIVKYRKEVNRVECLCHQKVEIAKALILDFRNILQIVQLQKSLKDLRRKAKNEYQFEVKGERVLYTNLPFSKINLKRLLNKQNLSNLQVTATQNQMDVHLDYHEKISINLCPSAKKI